MDRHVRILCIANILYGGATFLLAALALIFMKGFGGVYHLAPTPALGTVLTFITGFHFLIGLPSVVTGYLLMHYRERARLSMIVISALNLVNLPVGTILGSYCIWVLLSPETEPLFSNAEAHAKAISDKAAAASDRQTAARTTPRVIPAARIDLRHP